MRVELNKHRVWPAIGASMLLLAACGGSEEEAESEVQEVAQEAEEAAENVAEEISEAAEAAEEGASEMADEAEGAMEEAAAETESAMEQAQNDVQEAADNAMGAMNNMADNAMNAAEGAADDVQQGAEEMADEAKAMASNAADAMAGPVVHEIQMLNGDPDNPRERMVFRPDLVLAKPGDIIKFIPTDPSHQSSSVDGMLPDGAESWQGKVNEALEYTLPEPGVYGYKCVPHYAGGMVGLVVVQGEGMMDNVAEAKKVRQVGLAKRRFDDIWARAEDKYLK